MTMQWLTIAVISGSAGIILYGFKMMVVRFDRLIQEVQGLKEVTVSQDAKIGENKRRIDGNDSRLNDHADRIRKVELKQASFH
ncbi:hypothetical protein BZG01_00195 [Labilibaculum manganireducens]|uniref:Uncharacterized protein n=1 Tax=Labilibaculum manganireducens TaxID=1940525 RepID=A0A2N3IGM0_9BACT|nr:hypothetical protein [Labilibaculum manganireducens]PKQ69393.1 hypothetical protein BZG01_00195 [Labilibaculum manganireducens]